MFSINLNGCATDTRGYPGRTPKPIPRGKILLGKTYYPKGTYINKDGSLYIPAEAKVASFCPKKA